MQAGFCNDRGIIRSYGGTVRSVLDAATAYKVARSVGEDPENTRELLALGPFSIHTDLFRQLFKGGDVNIGKWCPFRAFVGPAVELPSKEERRCCLDSRHFQVERELCPKTVFTLSEPRWLRPRGSRKH